jgi:hypothetical protein
MNCDEPHSASNEKTQGIQWTERPTGALVAVGSFWLSHTMVWTLGNSLNSSLTFSSHLSQHIGTFNSRTGKAPLPGYTFGFRRESAGVLRRADMINGSSFPKNISTGKEKQTHTVQGLILYRNNLRAWLGQQVKKNANQRS